MEAILHGFILAFGLILPLGVQNVFVFNQGATQSRLSGALPAVIAAALCDTLLIALAVFGVSAIVLQFAALRFALMLIGAVFLTYMGFVLWRSRSAGAPAPEQGAGAALATLPGEVRSGDAGSPSGQAVSPSGQAVSPAVRSAGSAAAALPASRQILFALSVSLLNPHALLDTIGVIGTSALAYEGAAQLRFAAACIGVSWLWFAGLAGAGSVLRRFDGNGRLMRLFNRGSALFIWGTALYLLWSLLQDTL